jgi:hypothetical protein
MCARACACTQGQLYPYRHRSTHAVKHSSPRASSSAILAAIFVALVPNTSGFKLTACQPAEPTGVTEMMSGGSRAWGGCWCLWGVCGVVVGWLLGGCGVAVGLNGILPARRRRSLGRRSARGSGTWGAAMGATLGAQAG